MAEIAAGLDPRTREIALALSDNPLDVVQGNLKGYLEDFIRITVGTTPSSSGWVVGDFKTVSRDLTANTSAYVYSDASGDWLYWNGAAVSRTTYANLFAYLVPLLGTFTVTIASPGVFTLANHGLGIGSKVFLTTTGALPTGLAQNTIYWVASVPTSSTFTLSATDGGAAINTSGTQSGTHSINSCPFGLGDGSTTFNLGDSRGRSLFFCGTNAAADLGDNDGVTEASRQAKHAHTNGLSVSGTFGSDTHTHSTTTGGPSATVGVQAIGGSATVGTDTHTHAGTSGAPSATASPSLSGTIGTGTSGDAPAHLFIGSLLVRF